MNYLKYLFFLIFYQIYLLSFSQQDPLFTQYMFNPLNYNPAYTGSREVISFSLTSRNQWISFPGTPQTNSFIIHSPIVKQKMGLGFQILNDKIGPKNIFAILGTYAYKIHLATGKLSFGLRAGIYRYQYNWDKIEYNEPDNIVLTIDNFTVPSFDFGLYYYSRTFYGGISLIHLNHTPFEISSPQDSLNFNNPARLYTHANLAIGKAFEINENYVFKPSILIRTVEQGPGNIDINASILFKQTLWVGLSGRWGRGGRNSAALITQINLINNLSIGYSYDLSLNKLRSYNSGTHEIFIRYEMNVFKSKMISPRYF